MGLRYFCEDVVFPTLPRRKTSHWIKEVIVKEGYVPGNINFIFCSDKYLHTINQQYLKHDTYTDIITFDQSEEEDLVEGDIYISTDRVNENALKEGTNKEDELHRVIIHGILHLVGYSDKGEKEKKIMREKEDACLSLRQN
ncbi:MAG: rRNA maturation RNase YbeY [Cyclobacteriaceae bacterium]|nr:rRNA maturation RNase YbeY [Cyclobacteriaceae bacterium]